MLSAGGIASFIRGVANGTKTLKTKNMTVCEQKVREKWDYNTRLLIN
jgi:hypothetical protein